MADFTVTWEIDISADTHEEAAQKAWEILRKPSSTANVFDVVGGTGRTRRVDLQEIFESGATA